MTLPRLPSSHAAAAAVLPDATEGIDAASSPPPSDCCQVPTTTIQQRPQSVKLVHPPRLVNKISFSRPQRARGDNSPISHSTEGSSNSATTAEGKGVSSESSHPLEETVSRASEIHPGPTHSPGCKSSSSTPEGRKTSQAQRKRKRKNQERTLVSKLNKRAKVQPQDPEGETDQARPHSGSAATSFSPNPDTPVSVDIPHTRASNQQQSAHSSSRQPTGNSQDSERRQRRRLTTAGQPVERGIEGDSESSSGSERPHSDAGETPPEEYNSNSSSEEAPRKRTEERHLTQISHPGEFTPGHLPASSASLSVLESFAGEGCQPGSLDRLRQEETSAREGAMGSCLATGKKGKQAIKPSSPAEDVEPGRKETSVEFDSEGTLAEKSREEWAAGRSGDGNRRRLSLVHAEPITHVTKEEPRGKLEVFQKKPKTLESKLSLEHVLNDPTGARVSISGAATYRVQGNFENKNETMRGNVRATSLANLGIGHACRKGLKPESPNQDDFFIYHLEQYGLYGVFDGHGPFGHDISNRVQQEMPKLIYNHPLFESDPARVMVDVFNKMQADIRARNDKREFDASLSGCTATVIIHDMLKNRLTVGHVGDSRAVMGQGRPGQPFKAMDLTEDHKPTLPRERERIEHAGGEVKQLEGDVPHRVFLKNRLYPGLAMSRALGDLVAAEAGVSAEPEVNQFPLEPGRDLFIVLCSDGVWEFISSQEAVEMIAREGLAEVQTAADGLARESWNKWITEEGDIVDDITVEIIYLFPRRNQVTGLQETGSSL